MAPKENPNLKWNGIGKYPNSFIELRKGGSSGAKNLTLYFENPDTGKSEFIPLTDDDGRRMFPGLRENMGSHGSNTIPVYINSSGIVTPSTGNVGTENTSAYMKNGEILPCKHKIWYYQINGNSTYTTQYRNMIFALVHRGGDFKLFSCDNWNVIREIASNNANDIEVSVSNKRLSIKNGKEGGLSSLFIDVSQ